MFQPISGPGFTTNKKSASPAKVHAALERRVGPLLGLAGKAKRPAIIPDDRGRVAANWIVKGLADLSPSGRDAVVAVMNEVDVEQPGDA